MLKRMVKVFTGCLLVVAQTAGAQDWGDAIDLGNGYTPDLDVNQSTGEVHVVHHNGSVIYSKFDKSGGLIEQFSVPNTNSDGEGRFKFGATVAVDPTTGRPHICYRANTSSDIYDIYYTKRNADGSWTSPDRLVANEQRGYSVRLAVDGSGVAHMVYGRATNTPFGNATYRRIQTNGNVDKTIGGLEKYRVDDRVEIAVGEDDIVHIVLSYPFDNPNGEVSYFRSTDGGNSMPSIGNIRDNSAGGRIGNADVFVDKTGTVHFAYGAATDAAINDRSVRYARWKDGVRVRDVVVNSNGELSSWHHGLGIGSVAANEEGNFVVLTYNTGDGAELRSRLSKDGGQNWQSSVTLASSSGGSEGRDKHVVRAWANNFYLAYPSFGKVFLRVMNAGIPPVADGGGPYSGSEGSDITFDASASAANDGSTISEYRWDFNNDDSIDQTSSSATINYAYPDDYTGLARVQVVDSQGLSDDTTFTVTVANKPPTANAGGPYEVLINQNVTLTATATDPGTEDVLTYAWDLNDDNVFETDGASVEASFSSGGAKTVRVRVTDDDGGSDTATATINVNAGSPMISSIPGQTVPENGAFNSISLDDFVSDPDHQKSEIAWSVFGNTRIQVAIANRIASLTVAPADSEWAGTEALSFVARDPNNNTDTTITSFTVTPVNDAPSVSAIPTERIVEGIDFSPLMLDNYVSDPDHADAEISWSTRSAGRLLVSINENRVATITPADPEWGGDETITFIATDAAGGQDSTSTLFSIRAVNDAPSFSEIPDQESAKGTPFSPLDFGEYVNDPDNDSADLVLTVSNTTNLNASIAGLVVTVTPKDADWIGTETLLFTVTDPSNAASSTTVSFTITQTTGVFDGLAGIPDAFDLLQNYPNPFNPQTTVPFKLKEAGDVSLVIYDLNGRAVTTLTSGYLNAGYHELTWQANRVASGTYIAHLTVRNGAGTTVFSARKKMLYIR